MLETATAESKPSVALWAYRTLRTLMALGLTGTDGEQGEPGQWVPESTWDKLRRLSSGEGTTAEIEEAIDAMEAAAEFATAPSWDLSDEMKPSAT